MDNANELMWSSIKTLMDNSFWGKSSSKKTLIGNLRSEVKELITACENNNSDNIREEASDVLMIMLCLIYLDDCDNTFDSDDLALRIVEKLKWRYGHLFSNEILQSDDEEYQHWEDAKIIEKKMQLMHCGNGTCKGFRKVGFENVEYRDKHFYCSLCGDEIIPSSRSMLFYKCRKNANKYFKDICASCYLFREGDRQAVKMLQIDHPNSFRSLAYYLESSKKEDEASLSVLKEYLNRKYRISWNDINIFLQKAKDLSMKAKKQNDLMENYYLSLLDGDYFAKNKYNIREWSIIRKNILKLQFDVEKSIERINQFQARSWDNQVVHKYLLELSKDDEKSAILECMTIIHYREQTVRDLTVELSNMYNCIVGCKFCASGDLPGKVLYLKPIDYIKQLNTCISESGVNPNDYEHFYVSFAGIGEPSFVYESITIAMYMIYDLYPNVHFNIATFGYRKECFDFWSKIKLPIRTLQIPLYHINQEKLERIVPSLPRDYSVLKVIHEAVHYKKKHAECRVKINYIPFKDINDSDQDISDFVNALEPFKSQIEVKVSFLNYTKPAEKNGFMAPEKKRLIDIKNIFCNNGYESYIFGTENNTEVGCGQLSQNHISENRSN